ERLPCRLLRSSFRPPRAPRSSRRRAGPRAPGSGGRRGGREESCGYRETTSSDVSLSRVGEPIMISLVLALALAQEPRPGVGVWDTGKPSAEPLAADVFEGRKEWKLASGPFEIGRASCRDRGDGARVEDACE